MVDLVLLEKFLLSVLPVDAHLSLMEAFREIRDNRLMTAGISFGRARDVFENEKVPQPFKFHYANGMITGILIASFAVKEDDKEMFKTWLQQCSRAKGENVVDFSQMKAGRDGISKQ